RTASNLIVAVHSKLGERTLSCDGSPDLVFTENETNTERLFNAPNRTPYVKDAFDNYLVRGKREAVNPEATGTKAAAHYLLMVPAGKSAKIRLRLREGGPENAFGSDFDKVMQGRRREADEFYASIIPSKVGEDGARVMRQALAGMLWSKQFYYYDVDRWLEEHGAAPFNPRRTAPRNAGWHHMHNAHIISMPDKWEYPWYAAWDLAFHVLALTLVDEPFGKEQLKLMLEDSYMHPSGQMPAYEWNFSDVNPPVHAWATNFTYAIETFRYGKGDID